MIQINILTDRYKQTARLEWRSAIFWRLAFLLIGVSVLSLATIVGGVFYIDRETKVVVKEYENLRTSIAVDNTTSVVFTKQKELSQIVNVIVSENATLHRWSEILSQTHNAMPESVTITQMEILEDAKVHVVGSAPDRETFLEIRNALTETTLFTTVDLPLSSLFASDTIPFDMTLTLTPEAIVAITL